MSDGQIIYQMGDHEVLLDPDGAGAGRKYHKVFICPNCFESIHLG